MVESLFQKIWRHSQNSSNSNTCNFSCDTPFRTDKSVKGQLFNCLTIRRFDGLLQSVLLILLLSILSSQVGNAATDISQFSHKNSIYERANQIFETHFYHSLDSTLRSLSILASVAEKNQWWDANLELYTTMANCAYYHYNSDTMAYYLRKGDAIISNHPSEIDNLDHYLLRAKHLYFWGAYYAQRKDHEQSIKAFKQVLDYKEEARVQDSLVISATYTGLGKAYQQLSNYEEAGCYFRQASQWIPNDGRTLEPGEKIYFNAINNYNQWKANRAKLDAKQLSDDTDTLKHQINESISYFQALENVSEFQHEILSGYLMLAEVYLHSSQYDSAHLYAQKALEVPLNSSFQQIKVYNVIGDIYVAQRAFSDAEEAYNTSLSIGTHNIFQKSYEKAIPFFRIGKLYSEQQQWDKAVNYYQLALIQLAPNFDDTTTLKNPAVEDCQLSAEVLELVTLKAEALSQLSQCGTDFQNLGFLKQSLNTYQLAVSLIERMRQIFTSEEYQMFIANRAADISEQALEVAYRAYRLMDDPQYLNAAFSIIEKHKSQILLKAVQSTTAQDLIPVPSKIIEKGRLIREQISYLEKESFSTENQSCEQKALQWELLEAREKYQEYLHQMENDFPQYYQLIQNIQVVETTDVQAKLEDQEMLINYFYGEHDVYMVGLTAEKKMFVHQPVDAELTDAITSVSNLMSANAINGDQYSNYVQYIKAGRTLYKKLLKPFNILLPKVDKLIIVPDGILNYLSWDLVLTETFKSDKVDYKSLPYLIKEYAIRNEYSATLALQSVPEKSTIPAKTAYFGFAPSYTSTKQSNEPNQEAEHYQRNSLKELNFNDDEILHAAKLFNGKAFLAKQATEASFKAGAAESHMIHLSMHAFVNNENPMMSGLAFTPTDDKEDGFLHIWEMYGMQLKAKLAILSACETGVGKLTKGEGALSLGRAFKYAGCPSIAMSLWEVNDRSTKEIINIFCDNLKDGLPKDEALRMAKLAFLNNANVLKTHPYYWSAFVLVGNDDPLYTTNLFVNIVNWRYFGITILTLLVFGGWYKKSKYKTYCCNKSKSEASTY